LVWGRDAAGNRESVKLFGRFSCGVHRPETPMSWQPPGSSGFRLVRPSLSLSVYVEDRAYRKITGFKPVLYSVYVLLTDKVPRAPHAPCEIGYRHDLSVSLIRIRPRCCPAAASHRRHGTSRPAACGAVIAVAELQKHSSVCLFSHLMCPHGGGAVGGMQRNAAMLHCGFPSSSLASFQKPWRSGPVAARRGISRFLAHETRQADKGECASW